jgi:hypothetical protein
MPKPRSRFELKGGKTKPVTFTLEGDAALALIEMRDSVGTISKKKMAERIAVFIHLSILSGEMHDAAMAIIGVELKGVGELHTTVSKAIRKWTVNSEKNNAPQQ